jgi:hypothetical protein
MYFVGCHGTTIEAIGSRSLRENLGVNFNSATEYLKRLRTEEFAGCTAERSDSMSHQDDSLRLELSHRLS